MRKHWLIVTLVSLGVFSGIAWAAQPIAALYVRLSAAGNSRPCPTGQACLWRKTSDDSLHYATPTTDAVVGLNPAALFFSPVDAVNSGAWTSTIKAGSYSTGSKFMPTVAMSITGARFYWAGGVGAKTIKVSLWNNGTSTRVATTTIAVNAAGIYTPTFSSAYAITGSSVNQSFSIAIWENSGTNFFSVTPDGWRLWPGASSTNTFGMALWGPSMYCGGFSWYGAGDVSPATSWTTSDQYPVEPTFTVP